MRVQQTGSPHDLARARESFLRIRDHRAEVTLRPEREGTAIRWHSTFRAKIPGTGGLARRQLQRFIELTAAGLASEAERTTVG